MQMTLTLPGARDPLAEFGNRLADLFGPLILAITTAMATSFKQEILVAGHNFTAPGGHNFRLALFDATATMDAATATYTGANEIVGAGYTAGGKLLTAVTPVTGGTTAWTDFDDQVWTASTFTARGAQIFNNTNGNASVGVFDFGANIPVVSGNFSLFFPTANATAAVIRIG